MENRLEFSTGNPPIIFFDEWFLPSVITDVRVVEGVKSFLRDGGGTGRRNLWALPLSSTM